MIELNKLVDTQYYILIAHSKRKNKRHFLKVF